MDRDSAQMLLKPYCADLSACINAGFESWQAIGKIAPGLRAPIKTRTRANWINDSICAAAIATFSGRKSVKVIDSRGFLELVIAPFVIRFKKLDSKGRSRNILTKQQRGWFEPQMRLPEMPPLAEKIIAGYILNELGTEIANVLVTYPSGAWSIDWAFELEDDAASNVVEIRRKPAAPVTPKVRSTKRKTEDEDGPA